MACAEFPISHFQIRCSNFACVSHCTLGCVTIHQEPHIQCVEQCRGMKGRRSLKFTLKRPARYFQIDSAKVPEINCSLTMVSTCKLIVVIFQGKSVQLPYTTGAMVVAVGLATASLVPIVSVALSRIFVGASGSDEGGYEAPIKRVATDASTLPMMTTVS